jgi:riboflavin biosynthesis pyrimidine reductase
VEPLELLFEPPELPSFALPGDLAALYPGSFGLPEECVYANFVETLDGRVALPDVPRSNRLISDESDADLFVMALLRACADAIVVGSKTLLASPKNRWTAEAACKSHAGSFAELRRALGLAEHPDVVVLTRGRDLEAPEQVRERMSVRPDAAEAIAELRAQGKRRVLCEGGPTLFGRALEDGLVDELFLTLSPIVAGDGLSLVEGVELLPGQRVAGSLLGVRRHGAHLFLRYAFER